MTSNPLDASAWWLLLAIVALLTLLWHLVTGYASPPRHDFRDAGGHVRSESEHGYVVDPAPAGEPATGPMEMTATGEPYWCQWAGCWRPAMSGHKLCRQHQDDYDEEQRALRKFLGPQDDE